MSEIKYGNRLDSKTAQEALSAPRQPKKAAKWRIDQNAAKIIQAVQEAENLGTLPIHMDSATFTNRAYFLARELEYAYQEVLREEYAPNNALELFAIDSSVPVGAKTHTVERIQHEAEWRYYRGNAADRGSTGARRVEKQFPVHPMVSTIKLDFFEMLSHGFANSNLQNELQFAARQGLDDFLNDKIWFGDEDRGVRGVLNYDWLPKSFSAVPFNDTSSADEILAELHRLRRFSYIQSKQRFSPNRVIFGTALMDYLGSRKRSGTTDQTILEAFLQDCAAMGRPLQMREVHELNEVGPAGEDAILFDRANDRRSIANVMPAGFSMLPMQTTGFDMEIPCYAIHGGVIMRFPLNNHLAYVSR